MSGKWELYDSIIDGIPPSIQICDFVVGCAWTMVRTELGCGVALTVRQRAGVSDEPAPLVGASLRNVAARVKSWNFIEASIGMAAINAWYNNPERAAGLGLLPHGDTERKKSDVFRVLGDEVRGKKVAVIGHFPNLEKQLKPVSELSILEREPQRGDYPDSACEYILDEQDYVIITGMTLTNKTLPRLLELVRPGAKVCLVGPSVPLTEKFAEYGVFKLSGFCATDAAQTEDAVKRGVRQGIFQCGYMVDYTIA